MSSAPCPAPGLRRAPVLAVASGKGGVGKSTFVANLAVSLARLGQKVLVLDADFSLANLDVLLGLAPQHTIQHFFTGVCSLADVIVEGPGGIHVIPAASGVADLAQIDPLRRRALVEGIEAERASHDHVLVDAPAGIGEHVVQLGRGADLVLVVVTPEPTSLVDAYATIKVLASSTGLERIGLIVNGARDEEETRSVHGQIDRVCRRFLGGGIAIEGSVFHDEHVGAAVREQRAVVELHPTCKASRCFQRIAARLARTRRPGASRTPALFGDLLDPREDAPVH
jgi:flagellar biosynthesis protein FlhG